MIQISNTSTHLVINNAGNIRQLLKQNVREVSILGNNTLKLDIGGGALRNIFLPIADITAPVFDNPETLVNAVNALLTPPEIAITDNLHQLQNTITEMEGQIANLLPASMQEPLYVDESNPNVIYSGFAPQGSSVSEPVWAIMRTTIHGDIIQNEWAGGTQQMNSVWDNRRELEYA